LQSLLARDGAHVDAFFFCLTARDNATAANPAGLFEQAVAQFPEIRTETSIMIGDSFSDIEFGRRLEWPPSSLRASGAPKARSRGSRRVGQSLLPVLAEAVDALLEGR